MHGTILAELKKFSDTKFGPKMWERLLKEANIKWKIYLPIQSYPDSEAVAIVGAASKLSAQSVPAILEAFGEFIAPHLVQMYSALSQPEWGTLDVIEHTENVIHTVVRARESGAQPPRLKTSRISPDEVRLVYDSPRQMCDLAKGITKGLARMYGENVAITESQCMHEGAKQCEIWIRKT